MDITPIIDPLNDAQRSAVTAPNQAVLVLAGAGSGKTRVLVHRIAWQIKVEAISAHSILAVTFTNKAAREMRNRIEDLLCFSTQTMWIGTFHGLAHRLLRRHAKQAKLPDTFQVMDSADQLRIIKRLVASLNLDEAKWPPKQIQWFINAQKDEGKRARHQLDSGDVFQRQMLAVYRAYEELCDRSGLVDFAELLLRAHELLRDNPDLLEFYQQRFLQVHVDEFQDTNTIQYAWLRLLTEGKDNLFVVGDDDQSIYGWRGARIENIFNFQRHYPNDTVIKLEQNYRSTSNILNAANKVISLNEARMGKELWTDAGEGELISLYSAFNELDEAYFVVDRIKAWVAEGGLRRDAAILYRSNAQSRQFEEKLMATAMPYRVYGGLRFFERAEIKNALAYLRLMANRDDDPSFERVINTPTRGLGAKTIDEIRLIAKDQNNSLWAAAVTLLNQKAMSPRAKNALLGFLELIDRLSLHTQEMELHEKVQYVNEQSGLYTLYKNEKGDRGEEKLENLDELINAARHFDASLENEENLSQLDLFLAHAALEAGDMQGEEFDDCVQLMTLHSAKGLEFKLVFLVGMEEGLFPSQQSSDDIERLEEERRLCYVGMTRAMRQLYLTYAESRRIYGKESYSRPSRFLREIPTELIQEVRMRAHVSRPLAVDKPMGSIKQERRFKLGQRVAHSKFGEGMVLQIEGEGAQERAQINFKQAGVKWLMLNYAQLEAL
jgi:DNA helicase II / ATP-dependent DNA helicase PcrA